MDQGRGVERSLPGEPSRAFSGIVGETYPATALPRDDLVLAPERFDSEGIWAFCRFTGEDVPAVRMGFQKGSFNIGIADADSDPSLLQLHLEVMTAGGGLLWLPTGQYAADTVVSNPSSPDIRMELEGIEALRIEGWPRMEWHLTSPEGELEVRLTVEVGWVTVLPDCLLPHTVFAMCESVGRATGTVRIGGRSIEVTGSAFVDHTRVLQRRHAVAPRTMYLYTTMALDDGSAIFGYHAQDDMAVPIDDYCFGVLVDADGRGRFLPDARLEDLSFDADGLPSAWRLAWSAGDVSVVADVQAREQPIVRAWGAPHAPRSRGEFSILPLVLDGRVQLRERGVQRTLVGRGLAEYYDASKWTTLPADRPGRQGLAREADGSADG